MCKSLARDLMTRYHKRVQKHRNNAEKLYRINEIELASSEEALAQFFETLENRYRKLGGRI